MVKVGRQEPTLSEVLDRVLARGVVASGDLVVSVAGIDLLYLGLRLILTSVDTLERHRRLPADEARAASKPWRVAC
jgi:hypothetical protein